MTTERIERIRRDWTTIPNGAPGSPIREAQLAIIDLLTEIGSLRADLLLLAWRCDELSADAGGHSYSGPEADMDAVRAALARAKEQA